MKFKDLMELENVKVQPPGAEKYEMPEALQRVDLVLHHNYAEGKISTWYEAGDEELLAYYQDTPGWEYGFVVDENGDIQMAAYRNKTMEWHTQEDFKPAEAAMELAHAIKRAREW